MAIRYDTTLDVYLQSCGRNPSLLAIAPKVCGGLSMASSCYVVQDILRSPGKRSQSTHHRVMLGLSIADIVSSIVGNILSTWPIPRGYHLFAAGSIGTCDAVGFFNTLTIFATPVYYCSLTTYYLVQLRYNWLDRDIRAIEKWLHIVPWSLGLVAAVTGLATNSYGPTPSTCWLTRAYPIGCDDPGSPYECERGNPLVFVILSTLCVTIVILSISYVIVTMSMVYRHMHGIEQKALTYSFAFYKKSHVNCLKRSRRVMVQGILYTAVLVFLNLFFLVGELSMTLAHKEVVIILNMSTLFLYPLQGFFNALIYAIPTFQRLYKRLADKRQEKRRNKLNRSTVTVRSYDLFSFFQSSNNGKDGKNSLKEHHEETSNETIEEVSTEEEEEEMKLRAPIDHRKRQRTLYNKSNQECVSRSDYSTSNLVGESSNDDQQEEKMSESSFHSLGDLWSDGCDSINDDDDDYLSLRFLTEDQREKSVLSLFQENTENECVYEDCSNQTNYHFPIPSPHHEDSLT